MKNLLISYMTLRQWIGILGMLLAGVCVIGGLVFANTEILPSISMYYHSNMRDVFVGLLIAVGMFLLTYKGYDKKDHKIMLITGFSALMIPLFPCTNIFDDVSPVGFMNLNPNVSNFLHLLFAGLFFVLLAYNSYFMFTRTNPLTAMTPNKIKRNKIYRISGITIFVCIILLVLSYVIMGEVRDQYKIVLVLEQIMLVAFGISWLVKGEAMLKDQ
jgi:hypothetical protein